MEKINKISRQKIGKRDFKGFGAITLTTVLGNMVIVSAIQKDGRLKLV